MNVAKVTACAMGIVLFSSLSTVAYANQTNNQKIGNNNACIVQTAGNGNSIQIETLICYFAAGISTISAPPLNPRDPTSVVLNGGWWAEYYKDEFGEYVQGKELLNQNRNGGRLGVGWGNRRPEMFPQGRGVRFSMKLYGRRFFEPGQHCFTAHTDRRNYTRVTIDQTPILSHWYPVPGGDGRGCFETAGGLHVIKVEYMNRGGGAQIGLSWN